MRNKKVLITAGVIIASAFLSAVTPVLAHNGNKWEQRQRDQVQKDILFELKKMNGNCDIVPFTKKQHKGYLNMKLKIQAQLNKLKDKQND